MELFKPDFGLIFWMFVAFGILFFCLWKWAWPVIIKGVESRADLIDKGVEYAQSAKEQLDNARAEADRQIAEARRQQADILREADKMKTRIIEEARDAARVEARKVMDAAKLSIDQGRGSKPRRLSARRLAPWPSPWPTRWCASRWPTPPRSASSSTPHR